MNRKSDKKVSAVENVKEYRKNKSKYLPLIDHETEIFEKKLIMVTIMTSTLVGIADLLTIGRTF